MQSRAVEITLCEALISCKQGREKGGKKAFIPVTNHLRFPNAVSQRQRQRLINWEAV